MAVRTQIVQTPKTKQKKQQKKGGKKSDLSFKIIDSCSLFQSRWQSTVCAGGVT